MWHARWYRHNDPSIASQISSGLIILTILLLPINAYCSYLFFKSTTPTVLSEWHHDSQNRCYLPGKNSTDHKAAKKFKKILAYIQENDAFAETLIKTAKATGVAFCLENRADGTRGYYDYQYNIIAVRESLNFYQQVAIVLHELRHVMHVTNGYRLSLKFSMIEMVRMTYAIEADVQAFSMLFAWRLKNKGLPHLWSTLLLFKHYSDIAKAFEREMLQTNDELRATKQAFIQWYSSSWRKTNYHKGCCMGYLDMLDESNLIESYEYLPQDFFDRLCILPDGRNYACHTTDVIKKAP